MVESEQPLVISCRGATRLATLAADVAAGLQELGVAAVVQDLDRTAAAAARGRGLIVVDGCPSSCRARELEARGLQPQVALNLAELGADGRAGEPDPVALAEETASRLRARTRPARQARTRSRLARPAPATRTKRAHAVDDYLLAIDALASVPVDCGALLGDAPTLAAHVSRLLAVSRPAAGEMLHRLEASGLVERSPAKELRLTRNGHAAADAAAARQRVLECFAADVLGYSTAECYDRARVLAAAFDDDAVERVRRSLGDPERCPHGWPIDPRCARDEGRELAALSALAEGEAATVVRVVEHDGPLLEQLAGLGLVPGATLTAGRSRTGSDWVAVELDGVTRVVDAAAAAAVLVRRPG